MTATQPEQVLSVAVVDDDPGDAESLVRPLADYGFEADAISDLDPAQGVDEFLTELAGSYDALICDHVLRGRTAVRFTGAELVCKANRRPGRALPAVLVSSHVNTDQKAAILRWREGIPRVVDKSEASEQLMSALDYTLAELGGQIARERRSFPTPIEVLEVLPDVEEPVAKVVVVGWRIASSVWMPVQPITEATGLRPGELPGRWLEADVNCHARNASDLYFQNIVIAPDPPDDWMSA
ncbi:response regulator [Streptomyces gobiensis]|uniref:response regulator n=1 Tax=Streptomyces gobiensis TaxID=2875706 RepID=UPI001E5EF8BB|nr:response regulator [Streptomyces gobiensis]UGY90774.1 response regulator [Streptomyces gobiensis]